MTKKNVSKNTKLSYKRNKRNKRNTHSNTRMFTRRSTRIKKYTIQTQNAGAQGNVVPEPSLNNTQIIEILSDIDTIIINQVIEKIQVMKMMDEKSRKITAHMNNNKQAEIRQLLKDDRREFDIFVDKLNETIIGKDNLKRAFLQLGRTKFEKLLIKLKYLQNNASQQQPHATNPFQLRADPFSWHPNQSPANLDVPPPPRPPKKSPANLDVHLRPQTHVQIGELRRQSKPEHLRADAVIDNPFQQREVPFSWHPNQSPANLDVPPPPPPRPPKKSPVANPHLLQQTQKVNQSPANLDVHLRPPTHVQIGELRRQSKPEHLRADADAVIDNPHQRRVHMPKEYEDVNLTHVWYRNWPDHDAPNFPEFKKFITKLYENIYANEYNFNNDDDTIIIHCSAGVGRSGTILIILQLERQFKNTNIMINEKDIIDSIRIARTYRNWLVQTKKQYKFICNYFNIITPQLVLLYEDMNTHSRFISKYKGDAQDISSGEAQQKPAANRYTDILPYNFNRVQLSDGIYINASNMETIILDTGNNVKIILAQGPIGDNDTTGRKNTVNEFLQMCIEKQVRLIIMLTGLVELKDGKLTDKCADYMYSAVRPNGSLSHINETYTDTNIILCTKYKLEKIRRNKQDTYKSTCTDKSKSFFIIDTPPLTNRNSIPFRATATATATATNRIYNNNIPINSGLQRRKLPTLPSKLAQLTKEKLKVEALRVEAEKIAIQLADAQLIVEQLEEELSVSHA